MGYQLDAGARRLLWCGPERKIKTLLRFFRMFGKERSARLKFVCSDMWGPYLKVIAKKAPNALNVLDRFHIMKKFGEALDLVRRQEVAAFKAKGQDNLLKHGRWALLKRPETLTEKQTVRLSELLTLNLKSVRAYLLREDFQRFWSFTEPAVAAWFLDTWCTRTMRSRLDPMKKVAKMLRPPQASDYELVHGGKHALQRGRGGHEFEGEIGDAESLRIQVSRVASNRLLSFTWQTSGASKCFPPILLKSQIKREPSISGTF